MVHPAYMTFRLARNIAGNLDRLCPVETHHLALRDQLVAEVLLKEHKAAELFDKRTDGDEVNDLYRSLMKLYDDVRRLREEIKKKITS